MEAASPKEFIPTTAPVHQIACAAAFNQLSDKEKLYAYHMAQAAWHGSKVCWFQRSYEAPALLVLLKFVFSSQPVADLKETSLAAGTTQECWEQFITYSASVFQNCGNYKSFGDTKFVPQCTEEAFFKIIESSSAFKKDPERINKLFNSVKKEVFTEAEPFAAIGFRDENKGTTSYYSSNVTKADAKFIDEWCQELKISPLNTRLLKTDDNTFELLVASQEASTEKTAYLKKYEKDGKTLTVTGKDFGLFMGKVVDHMKLAKEFVADENQGKMVDAYEEHFKFGDIDMHKKSQEYWIKDVGPIVETDIGFIETYLDPLGARAEFEGFVAVVDKVVSKKFNTLVERAEGLIEELPWEKVYEKPKFSRPDFTNLDIVAFACSGTPIGINIPNYDDIRMNFGFKNVNLGNVYPSPDPSNIQFLDKEDVDGQVRYSKESLTLIVALHELLGHGTGQLFCYEEGDKPNFAADAMNPYTGKPASETAYKSGETWSQKFGKLHSGYEECRADSVALYLMNYEEPFKIFFEDQKEHWDEIYYHGWLDILYQAVRSLKFYNPDNNVWGQAHCLAAWAIFSVVRKENPDLIKFTYSKLDDGRDYFHMKVDRSRLRTDAHKSLSNFLKKLHELKSLGDFTTAEPWFNEYAAVDAEMLKIRDLVLLHQLPRRLELQPNLFLKDGKVEYKDYDKSHEGIVQSFVERWEEPFLEDVYTEFNQHAQKFRYPEFK